MTRAVVVAMLAVLGALYLYSAFAPDRPRRYFSQPFNIGWLRRSVHAFLGVVLLLGVLLLLYAAFTSIIEDYHLKAWNMSYH
jgi:hypothetical protein